MAKYKNTYRSESARRRGWDYSQPGSYFITACTKNRRHFFGKVINKVMRLNEIGKIAKQYWEKIPDHYPNTTLGEFQVMPDHIHGIIIINGPAVETGHAPSLRKFAHAN